MPFTDEELKRIAAAWPTLDQQAKDEWADSLPDDDAIALAQALQGTSVTYTFKPDTYEYNGQTAEVPQGTPRSQVAQQFSSVMQPEESRYERMRREVLQGLSLGWGDEMQAGLEAAGGALLGKGKFGDLYDQKVRNERLALDVNRARHPTESTIANIGGSLPWMAVPGSIAIRGGRGASAVGAGLGAVAGAGAGDDIVPGGGLPGRAAGALAGAGTGFMLGGKGVTSSRVRQGLLGGGLAGAVAGAGYSEGPPIDRLPASVAGGASGGLIGGSLPLLGAGLRGARRQLFGSTDERATNAILGRLKTDELTPDDVGAKANEIAGQGKPAVLADAAGDSTVALAKSQMIAGPSQAKTEATKFLADRAKNQGRRIADDIVETTGVEGDKFASLDALRKVQQESAAPLYEAAFEAGKKGTTAPNVVKLLDRPDVKAAYARAKRAAANEGRALPELYRPKRNTAGQIVKDWQTGEVVTERIPGKTVDLETLDMLKRSLDDMIDWTGKPLSGATAGEQRILKGLRSEFVGAVDEAFPDSGYAEARKVFAGAAEFREAIEEGAAALNKDPREIRRDLAKLGGDSQREAYRLGLIDEMKRQRIERPGYGRDKIKSVFDSPEKEALFAEIIDDPAQYEKLMGRAESERLMRRTEQGVKARSDTAENMAESEQVAAGAQAGSFAAVGQVPRALSFELGRFLKSGRDREGILRRLLNPDRKAQELTLQQLRELDALYERMRTRPITYPAPVGAAVGQGAAGLLGRDR